jgi:major membrane immunogen (membrane-anchored lipoprotein)
MKKVICIIGLIISASLISGCDESKTQQQTFAGHWKAVSKDDGSALHPKFSSVMDITCSENSCHVVNKKRSVLSDEEMVSDSDWNIKDGTTLMKGNGLVSIYVKDSKLIASNYVYERQKE